ncbi:hypothetical protein Tco_0098032 [Tanacetum coccineum]
MGRANLCALPKERPDFVVYNDSESARIGIMLVKREKLMLVLATTEDRRIEHDAKMMVDVFSEFDFEAKYHLGKANVDVVP